MEILKSKVFFDIAKEYKYVKLRFFNNDVICVNTGIFKTKHNKKYLKNNEKTPFISYKPISLNEYISKKIPFLS